MGMRITRQETPRSYLQTDFRTPSSVGVPIMVYLQQGARSIFSSYCPQVLSTGNFAGRTFCQTQFARKRIYTHCSLARRFPKLRPRGPCTLVLAFGNACPPKLWWGAVTTHERSVPNSGQGRGHPHLVVRPNRMVKGKLFRRPVFCVLPCKVSSHKSVRRQLLRDEISRMLKYREPEFGSQSSPAHMISAISMRSAPEGSG